MWRIHFALLVISAAMLHAQDKPVLPENFIARPTFINADGSFEAGTAFFLKPRAASAANAGYIITAHHLFGPMGGLESDISPEKLNDVVTSIRMTGIGAPWSRVFRVRPILVPSDPGLTSENPFYNKHVDLAIFSINPRKGIHMRALSPDRMKIGERVWQAGEPRYGQEPGELLHGCKIIKVTGGHGFCLFDNQDLVLGGTSGSPYLNSKGEIIGLHSGSTKEPGKLTGIILKAEIIRQALP